MSDDSQSGYQLLMSIAELEAFIAEKFPAAKAFGITFEAIERGRLRVRLPWRDSFLRPGGTVAGPVLMNLADLVMYCLILGHIGPVELAVTTHLSIDFLRRAAPGDVLADAELLKLGKRLAVGTVAMRSATSQDVIAHASVTYSIPPQTT